MVESSQLSLKELLCQIKACRICEAELPLGPNPIVRASFKARILIAGQAPGIKVHKTSIPFNDQSGVRLREWMGIDDSTFYDSEKIAIVPMGFCYPGKGSHGDLPPLKICAETWNSQLLSQLKNIRLTLVIGQYAQAYFLKSRCKETLTQTVKQWQDYGPNVLPLPHPSPRNNIWLSKNPWFKQQVLPVLKEKVSSLLKT